MYVNLSQITLGYGIAGVIASDRREFIRCLVAPIKHWPQIFISRHSQMKCLNEIDTEAVPSDHTLR
jgi:hypothetical protein